jgi:hypothetical protein
VKVNINVDTAFKGKNNREGVGEGSYRVGGYGVTRKTFRRLPICVNVNICPLI